MGDDILKTAIDWTKAEALSSSFFILFGVGFLLASFGFWQIGKTDLAKAYVIPSLIAGGLLLVIGLGIFVPSLLRITGFVTAYNADAAGFIADELIKADKILAQYSIAVFRVIPLIVILCAGLMVGLDAPIWRASLITTIAMMAVIMMIDSNASVRLQAYKDQLVLAKSANP